MNKIMSSNNNINKMDLASICSIVLAVFTAVTGGGWLSSYLSNRKATKKKPELENLATEANTEATSVDTAMKVISTLQDNFTKLDTRSDDLRNKYEEKCEENAVLRSDITACSMMLCRNYCPLRRPEKGQGLAWFTKHKNDDCIECESDGAAKSIEEIAEERGYILKRIEK